VVQPDDLRFGFAAVHFTRGDLRFRVDRDVGAQVSEGGTMVTVRGRPWLASEVLLLTVLTTQFR